MLTEIRYQEAGRWSVAVTFGLPQRTVDELIGLTQGTASEASRWFVFGTDMSELATLHANWDAFIDLTIILLPSATFDGFDAAMAILEAEAQTPAQCAWIHGAGMPLLGEAEFRFFIDAREMGARSIAAELQRMR